MEHLDQINDVINSQKHLGPMLIAIALALCFNVMVKIGEVLWDILKNKEQADKKTLEKLTEALHDNTKGLHEMKIKLSSLEEELAHIPKFKTDFRRIFSAVRRLAGDDWPEIRKQIMEEEDL